MQKTDDSLYDAIIVGGGPAGLTAAIYLARACYRVLVIEKERFGGQITITDEVVNYPGLESISGAELGQRMQKQGESFGAEYLLAEVKAIKLKGDIKEVVSSRSTFRCLAVLLATGAHPRAVGFENEEAFRGHGVAYCATCDGEFFRDKEVFVVGGGFAAAEESVFLTRYASHVTILVRGDDFRCAKKTADVAKNHPKITVLTNTEVDKVEGDTVLRSITYHNNKSGKLTRWSASENDTFGVFVFAGYVPSTALVEGIAELNPRGYVVTDHAQRTTREGLYAAGDVCIKELRQVVTATSDGALAATEMEKYISELRQKSGLATRRVQRAKQTESAALATKATGTTEAANKKAQTAGLFTQDIQEELAALFSRFEHKLILELHSNDELVSTELSDYMRECAALTDKLSIIEAEKLRPEKQGAGKNAQDDERLPFVRVLKSDGSQTGYAFHGVPGGHEFTSFVLTLYNLAGPGQALPNETRARIQALDQNIRMQVMVSLSCTMCPDLVTAAGRIASLNPKVSVDIYDINHFPLMKEKYNVMSVPCLVINKEQPQFGRKTIDQLLDLLENTIL